MADPDQENKSAKHPSEKQEGWIEKLARQSSGVAQPEAPKQEAESEADAQESRKLWRLAGFGLQFAATVALFWFFGHLIDVSCGWNGGATIAMTSVAIAGSLYLLIKEAIRANK